MTTREYVTVEDICEIIKSWQAGWIDDVKSDGEDLFLNNYSVFDYSVLFRYMQLRHLLEN